MNILQNPDFNTKFLQKLLCVNWNYKNEIINLKTENK